MTGPEQPDLLWAALESVRVVSTFVWLGLLVIAGTVLAWQPKRSPLGAGIAWSALIGVSATLALWACGYGWEVGL